MLLDSSAILAIVLQEPGWEALRDRIDHATGTVAVSAITLLETHIVLTNRLHGRDALPLIEALLAEIGVEVVPFTAGHWRLAAEAFLRYGKGRHPASLNFGDCAVYGTARGTDLPVLYKGDDFSKTDLDAVDGS